MPEIPEPDYDDPKEVYAFFGLTYYQAAVLEHGVLNLAVAMLAKDIAGVTVSDVDKLYESFDKSTFGQVINAAKEKFNLPTDLESDLTVARKQRNYLAHRYFVVHDHNILTQSGRKKMIEELIGILNHLVSVDRRMDDHWKTAWQFLGVSKEWIERKTQEYIQNRRDGDK